MRTLRILAFLALTTFVFFSCQKEYSLEGGNITTIPGTWEFRDSTILYRGNMDTGFVETSGSTKILRLQGTSFDGLEDFELILYTNNASFTTGTYLASNGEAAFEYSKGGRLIYEANQIIGEFAVTISSINSTNVTGTFTGFALDTLNKLKTLTAGKFTSRYDNGANAGIAQGTLGANAGVCTPITTSGTFTQGTAMDATNKAQVTVNVSKVGTYSINTNTANGVSFSAANSFTSTGAQTVDLLATGTPTAAGTFTYTVTFGTGTCTFPVTFVAAGPPSAGSLGGTPGACTPATPAGTYTQGTAMAASNTVTIKANVTTVGSYSIKSDTVNGVSFSKSGTFTTATLQDVILQAAGTPVASGPFTFTVKYGTSTCTFFITFAVGTTPPTGDYFPTTVNSNWVYEGSTGQTFADSFKVTSTALTSTFAGNTYNRFHQQSLEPGAPPTVDTFYYRKTTNNYFQFAELSDLLQFDAPQWGELNFLRDNVATGGTWTSSNFSGTVSTVPVTASIKYTILAKGVPVTIGALTFPDVIKVQYDVFYNIIPGVPIATVEQWFAKGVGTIYIDADGFDEATIKRYQVF